MGPTWGPPGSCRPQMGPCWLHETCYQGIIKYILWHSLTTTLPGDQWVRDSKTNTSTLYSILRMFLLWLHYSSRRIHVIYLPIFFRITPLCPSLSEVALKDMAYIIDRYQNIADNADRGRNYCGFCLFVCRLVLFYFIFSSSFCFFIFSSSPTTNFVFKSTLTTLERVFMVRIQFGWWIL